MTQAFRLALLLLLACVAGTVSAASSAVESATGLARRIAPAYADRIVFEPIADDDGKDVFELESHGDRLVIRGNDGVAMATGLGHYLKYYARTSVSWYADDPVQLPDAMPQVSAKLRRTARVDQRFFLNYCTFGYTMPWWTWRDWERLIDWMALNGVNMPLAITGQEASWYKVWKSFGLDDAQIRGYFTGPAYLPWHRMGNIDHWDGPLPMSWIESQVNLQKHIVARERALGMTPILPAFAGHVPAAIKTEHPNAKIKDLGTWGGFGPTWYSHFLDPFDPLFDEIQKRFLAEQTRQFGTDHVYGIDPFNEVTPPSWEPEYLANVSKKLYGSLTKVDPQATWLQMTWVFYYDRKHWSNERIERFVNAVPKGKMVLLDYYAEHTEVWKLTDSYFGQPFHWCYLGNFGGNTMLAGNVKEVDRRIEHAFAKAGGNLVGLCSTLEGFDVNPMMYEFVLEKAWTGGDVGTARGAEQWVAAWADRRAGREDPQARKAWNLLLETAYAKPALLGQGTATNARPTLDGKPHWTPNPKIDYDNRTLLRAWDALLQSRSDRAANAYDAVNIGRQVLGNHFAVLHDRFKAAYERHDLDAMRAERAAMLGALDDLDRLLATQPSMLLGKWVADARRMGKGQAEQAYFEHDARLLLSVWGGEERSLVDYANRSWAGLTRTYYRPRWEMFTDAVIDAARAGKTFDEKAFEAKVRAFEQAWPKQHDTFAEQPKGDSLQVARALYRKYSAEIAKGG